MDCWFLLAYWVLWYLGKQMAKYPGQDKMICGLEQLRIIGMLQLARKLPFVISKIRNYELLTIGQGIPTWGEGL